MNALQFPSFPFRLRSTARGAEIWDRCRARWYLLTPEEWVRQHVVWYLIEHLGYPAGRVAVEKSLKLNGMNKRADVVVYSATGEPFLLVECKSTDVDISQQVFDQAARYNLVLRVPYLMVTNGLRHFIAQINFEENNWHFLQNLPACQ
jgi:hypothetical protein